MPIYEYQCQDCGHELEAMQKVADPQLVDCSRRPPMAQSGGCREKNKLSPEKGLATPFSMLYISPRVTCILRTPGFSGLNPHQLSNSTQQGIIYGCH